MFVYKFPIHYVYKFWSWVTKIMKVLIFGQIQQRKMAASWPSWIWSISNLAHRYIQLLSKSFLFIMYINYERFDYRPNSAKKNGRQSTILEPIHLKFCTLLQSMIGYKFPIHYIYKVWSWVTQIMKVLIFSQIHKEKWPPVGHLGSDQSQILHTRYI